MSEKIKLDGPLFNIEFQRFLLQALAGDPVAQTRLGFLYEEGLGTKKSPREAFRWYKRAAKQGYPEAFVSVALCYMHGTGVNQNPKEATKWFKKGADLGDAEAMYFYGRQLEHGRGIKEDADSAMSWYAKAADAGEPRAAFELAHIYFSGRYGEKNPLLGVFRLEQAAEGGDAQAMYRLALCYRDGTGVEQDMREAVKWLKKSAEEGFARSMRVLAEALEEGNGTEQDLPGALNWYLQAAEKCDTASEEALARIHLPEFPEETLNAGPGKPYDIYTYDPTEKPAHEIALFDTMGYLRPVGLFKKGNPDDESSPDDGVTVDPKPLWGDVEDWLAECDDDGNPRMVDRPSFDVRSHDGSSVLSVAYHYLYARGGNTKCWGVTLSYRDDSCVWHHFFACEKNSTISHARKKLFDKANVFAALRGYFTGDAKILPATDMLDWYRFERDDPDLPVIDSASVSRLEKPAEIDDWERPESQDEVLDIYHKMPIVDVFHLARAGDPWAQCRLALGYDHGNVFLKSQKRAFYWYKLSADGGVRLAQSETALRYMTGDSVGSDPLTAEYYCALAAKQGCLSSAHWLADLLKRRGASMKKYVLPTLWFPSECGNVAARLMFAEIMYYGFESDGEKVEPDYFGSWQLFMSVLEKADDRAHIFVAENFLNMMLYKGVAPPVKRNSVDACVFWQKQDYSRYIPQRDLPDVMRLLYRERGRIIGEAMAGNPSAQYELSNLYELGLMGLMKNKERSMKWLRKAAKAGHPYAMSALGARTESGSVESLVYFVEGLKKGDLSAMMNYAARLANGKKATAEQLRMSRSLYETVVENADSSEPHLIDAAKEGIEKIRSSLSGKRLKDVFETKRMTMMEITDILEKQIWEMSEKE